MIFKPSKPSKPTPLARQLYDLLVLLVCTLAFPSLNALSQENTIPLKQEIKDFSDTLENKDKSDTYAKSSLKFTKQLQEATEDTSPQQLDILKGNLRDLNFGAYHETLYSLLKKISAEHTQKNAQEKQNWSSQIDTFIGKVKKACIDDASSLESEALLVEAAGLKLKQPRSINASSKWVKQERSKLDSASQLLTSWIEYKHHINKGDIKKAYGKLDYLTKAPSPFPIIEKSFIDKTIIETVDGLSVYQLARVGHGPRTKLINALIQQKKEAQQESTPVEQTPLDKLQREVIKKLETGKWDGKIVSKYAKSLESLEKQEKNIFSWQRRINSSIDDLGDCLLNLEKGDISKARLHFLLSNLGRTPVLSMGELDRKSISDLLPVLYLEIKFPTLKSKQPLNRYLFELLSEPKSISEISDRNRLLSICEQKHWHKSSSTWASKIPNWMESATLQYKWLSRAISAMEAEDAPKALYDFRAALHYAPNSGPATAQNFIENQLLNFRESNPELFIPSAPTIAKRLARAEKQTQELEAELKKMQIKK